VYGVSIDIGSYRTYEEWKHSSSRVISLMKNGSYRTYEEWKHVEQFANEKD